MGSLGQLAEQVAAVQELGAMVQRKLAGIIRDDPAGIDDDRLDLRLLPIPRHHSMS